MEWNPPTPPIGTPIQWFKTGRREAANNVCAGVVHQVHNVGHIDVWLFGANKVIPQVPHISDPKHQQRNHDAKALRGAWDFIAENMIPASALPPTLESDEDRAMRYLETMTSQDVAARMGDGWTAHRVAAIKRSRDKKAQEQG
jgi:hypothetical protein